MNLSFLSRPYWWDVIFALILFLCVRVAAARGAFRALSGMAGTLTGVLLGNAYQDQLAPILEPFVRPIVEGLARRADLNAVTGLREDSPLALLVAQSAQLTEKVGELYTALMAKLAELLTQSLTPILAFLLIFLASKFALQLICHVLDWDIPILSGLNRMAGGLLGAVTGLFTIAVLCWAVMRFAPADNLGLLSQPCLQQSFVGSLLCPLFSTTL